MPTYCMYRIKYIYIYIVLLYIFVRHYFLHILKFFQRKATEVRAQKGQLKKIEDLGAAMEERLILDNR